MRKLLLMIVVVVLLASCAPGVPAGQNTPAVTPVVQAVNTPTASPSPSQKGESVSGSFHTSDLERFFNLSSEDLCALLGSGYEDQELEHSARAIHYRSLGVSFEYGFDMDDKYISFDYDSSGDEPGMSLQRIVLSAFDYRGLSPASGFEEVRSTLGNTDLLALHKKSSSYDYALRYIIGGLRFVFLSPDEKGAGGLTLAITPSSRSQVLYKSCGEGQSISKTLTTGDLKKFLGFAPEDLDGTLGNGWSTFDEDTGCYNIDFEYLGVHFAYYLEEGEKEGVDAAYPGLPLNYIWIDDFDFRGLNKGSNFKEIMNVLGKSKIRKIPILDTYYFALRYKIDGLLFEFSSLESNEQASDGVSLRVMPV